MSADRVIASYLRIAREDLDDAIALAGRGSRNAVYHLEQAAEKVVRAILTSEGKHGGIGHHIGQMVDQIPDENPLKMRLRAIEHLAGYATAYRYPSPVGRVKTAPTREEFERDARVLSEVLDAAFDRFGVDGSEDSPAKNPGPTR